MMGGSYVANPLVFLVSTLFGLYILCVMLRFLFQLVRADFYNPISQFLVKVTNPPLIPLRRVIPGVAGIDMSALVLMLALQLISLLLISLITGAQAHPVALIMLSLTELLSLALNVFLFSILIQAILSWIASASYNPVATVLYQLNEPILGRIRRVIPPISGFDLSPLVAIIGLQLVKMLVIPPLNALAYAMG